MKFIALAFISTFLMANNYAVAEPHERCRYIFCLDKLFGEEAEPDVSKKVESGVDVNETKKKKEASKSSAEPHERCRYVFCLDRLGTKKKKEVSKSDSNSKQVKRNTNSNNFFSLKDDKPQNISVYTGTFDILDKEGDEQTNLIGVEHKNSDLFRDTWVGKFSPTTGAFVTGKSSVYMYTGVEADYNLGIINISPSFAPGYYQAGDGKDLGSALEFKSEIKVGVDIFKDSNLGYSYSHISNNDWGERNPGTDNQSITFSKKF
jgi:hypothetical protein